MSEEEKFTPAHYGFMTQAPTANYRMFRREVNGITYKIEFLLDSGVMYLHRGTERLYFGPLLTKSQGETLLREHGLLPEKKIKGVGFDRVRGIDEI